jgi:DNA repair protein RecO (recombination protein O)
MDWSDEGIFLSAKQLGEANAVAELFTLGHGRHLGLVRGGRSRRMRPLLQPGNLLRATWRARLSEHLGGFNVELVEAHAGRILDDPRALAAIGSLAGLARLLPERDPHRALCRSYASCSFDDRASGQCCSCAGSFSSRELSRARFERMRGDRR